MGFSHMKAMAARGARPLAANAWPNAMSVSRRPRNTYRTHKQRLPTGEHDALYSQIDALDLI